MNTTIESKSGVEPGRRATRPLALWVMAGGLLAAGAWLLQPVAATRPAQARPAVVAPFGVTGEVDQSHLVILDHTVAARDGVTHESDAPGASIAAYGQ